MESDDVHFETAEHEIIKEDEDKGATDKRMEGEESRKAGKPTSRIPTFQSSLARKRTTAPSAESSLAAKTEGSSREGQMKEKAETLRTKLPVLGDRETACLSPHIRSSSTDNLSLPDSSDPISETSGPRALPVKQNNLPEPKTYAAKGSEEPEGLLCRPSLRAEAETFVTDSTLEPQSVSIESCTEDKDSELFLPNELIESLSSHTSPEECLLAPSELSEGQKLYEDTTSFEEDFKNAHEEETPHLPDCGKESVMHDTGKQCLEDAVVIKKNEIFQAGMSSETPPKKRSTEVEPSEVEHSRRMSSGSRGKSFVLFCLFPTVVLLLGGFGQHIWLYGVPTSVSHLMVQLELHWFEGFWLPQEECSSDCRLTLVESLPDGLLFPHDSPKLPSISHTWTSLLNRANISVNIAAFYLTLRDSDIGLTEPSAMQGKEVFNQLKQLESKGVNLQVAVNAPQTSTADTDELAGTGAEIRHINFQNITGGIVHTKLWVVDKKHMYIGSANMDWRSLTQVKELGVSVEDCSCLAQDASRIFGVYWEIGGQKISSLPPYWPGRFSALSSSKYPLAVKFNGVPARVYLSSAPPQLSTYGRSDDLSAILSIIADAKEFIYVSVMDYFPMSQFTQPIRYWPAIDSALREAACARGVEVKLLVSCWSHSPGAMFVFLKSLSVLNKTPLRCNIHVNVFEVPSTPEQQLIPFARVNHAKYMVTDRVVYIGTSNWSENYFSQTAGVGFVVNQTGSVVEKGRQTVQNQLQKIFQRDWNSEFSQALSDNHAEYCSKCLEGTLIIWVQVPKCIFELRTS
ncbi:5'-3' exonuclease PLD3 isoform X2 [Hoplias malabaricus]|uniref:5'-3' exonuclease PLD3 isoform X2 n=1 Tax=Hoplias malabaricus TaxID=27720 RepID=UPI003461D086